jgi:hypothetical protein
MLVFEHSVQHPEAHAAAASVGGDADSGDAAGAHGAPAEPVAEGDDAEPGDHAPACADDAHVLVADVGRPGGHAADREDERLFQHDVHSALITRSLR